MTLPRSSRKQSPSHSISDIEKDRSFKKRVRNMKPITDTNSSMIRQMKGMGTTFSNTMASSMSPNSKLFNATVGSAKTQSLVDNEMSKIYGSTTRPSSNGRTPGSPNILSSRLSQSGFSSPRNLNPFEKKKYAQIELIHYRQRLIDQNNEVLLGKMLEIVNVINYL